MSQTTTISQLHEWEIRQQSVDQALRFNAARAGGVESLIETAKAIFAFVTEGINWEDS